MKTVYDGLMYQLEIRQDQVNFIPFSRDIDIVGYLFNIVLFIPLGLLTPIIWKKMNNLTNIIGVGFFFTMLIEISQLLNNLWTNLDLKKLLLHYVHQFQHQITIGLVCFTMARIIVFLNHIIYT